MKTLFLVCLISSLAAFAQQSTTKKQLDLMPSNASTTATVSPTATTVPVQVPPKPRNTGDIDMNQFQELSKQEETAQAKSRVKVNITCRASDGTIIKQGDAGYNQCMEAKANRIMNQPNPPEAIPHDPRTN